jgi:hypothetical protein
MLPTMTPKRAFWEAVATVCVPSLLFWGSFAYLLRAKVDAEAWPIYLVLVILPFPVCIPLYRRYLKGPQAQSPRSRQSYVRSAVFFAILSFCYLFPLLRHGWKRDIWLLLTTIIYLGMFIFQVICAVRTKPT